MTHPPLDRKGLAITVGTFLIWGVVPLYWHLLKAVPSFHIIAHRIVWSAVLVLGWLLLKSGLGWWRQIRAQPRAVPLLLAPLVALLLLSGCAAPRPATDPNAELAFEPAVAQASARNLSSAVLKMDAGIIEGSVLPVRPIVCFVTE